MQALAERGHKVTVISHFPREKPLKGYRDVNLKGTSRIWFHFYNIDDYTGEWYERFYDTIFLGKATYESCETALSSKEVQKFALNANETFDVIIMQIFAIDCFMGFVHKYQVPHIAVSSGPLMPWHNKRIGATENPSFVPSYVVRYSHGMDFLTRVQNSLCYLYDSLTTFLVLELPTNMLVKKYLGKNVPNFWDIAYNTSLIFENVHFTTSLRKPQVPSHIHVGGIHIGRVQQLPGVSITLNVS